MKICSIAMIGDKALVEKGLASSSNSSPNWINFFFKGEVIGEVHIKCVGYDYVYAYGSIVIFYDIMVDRSARMLFWHGLIDGQSVFFFPLAPMFLAVLHCLRQLFFDKNKRVGNTLFTPLSVLTHKGYHVML